MTTQTPFDTTELENEIKEANSMSFRNCPVCRKEYPLRQSDTKRYCSRKCSDIAMRVRDWERSKRGMNLKVLQAILKERQRLKKEVEKIIDEDIIRMESLMNDKKLKMHKNTEVAIKLRHYKELKSKLGLK